MVRIVWNDHELEGRDGQTIAGVLLMNNQAQWRTSSSGDRGIFCGIGVCHDCLVTVNGVENVRACQREATDGDVVEREVRS